MTAHDFHTATLLSDGKVLVAGGVINDRFDGWVSASAELYDPGSGSWTATTDMIEARWSHTATLLPDGRVLVTGSYINSGESRASAELYDPNSGSWTATRNMGEGRGGHTATMLPDGRVLVAGGYSGYNGYSMDSLASAELYDAGSGSWTATGDMAEARDGHTATLLPDGRVLVAGGRSSGGDALASA
ncbi:MAG: kelch repeat-containing protein, partial [Candidatus Limnocylindrales bacterium]|nr:kelch repeat-containing protein [Candidatus Limnocylindrales bacterium]